MLGDLGVTTEGHMMYIAPFYREIFQHIILPMIQGVGQQQSEYISDIDDLHREFVDMFGSSVDMETFRNWCKYLKIGQITLGLTPPPAPVYEPPLDEEEVEQPSSPRPAGAGVGHVHRPIPRQHQQQHGMFDAPPDQIPIPVHKLQMDKFRREQQGTQGYQYAGQAASGYGGVLEEIN